ncbi:MAG TPA: AAA family ATPase, partial [Trueperaceae bacterium]
MFLRTLGALELEGSEFRWSKPLTLLSYLALEGPQERRRLARIFWPQASDSMNSLTVALSQLRKGAPEAILADRKTVRSLVRCDVQALASALDAEDLERALGLYRGPFLAGVRLNDLGVELEEWLYQQRERVAGRLRCSLLQQAEAEAVQGRFGAAAQYAERAARLAEAAPLAPEALEQLHVLLLAGQSTRAQEVGQEVLAFGINLLRTPDQARERLRTELADASMPHNIPHFGTPLVGRTTELDELEGLLFRSDVRLVTIVGPGGIGKTRLALAQAERLVKRPARMREEAGFIHGVVFVPLAPVASGEGILPALAGALGLAADETQQARSPRQSLLDFLRDKRLLLVLDNFEHLLDTEDEGVLTEILRVAAGVKVVVTSRERLRLRDEHVLRIHGLELPMPGASQAEIRYPAAELFCRRARQVVPGFALGQDDAPNLHEICRLLEGMPLGLELAATWVDVLPLAEIAASIRKSVDFLEVKARDVPERHRSMRAVFDHSYEQLGLQEQAVFARLSV